MAFQGGTSKQVRNPYILFRNEFIRSGRKFKNMNEQAKEAALAWKDLSADDQKWYKEQLHSSNADEKREKKPIENEVAFNTRCSPRQLKALMDFVNKDEGLVARVKTLGFHNLLDIGTTRLPRNLLASLIQSYDPPTHQFRIRGKTRGIGAKDVHQLLGVPCNGEDIRIDVDDDDEMFKTLKTQYGKVSYTKILAYIKSGQQTDKFELLFMMYVFGTFLAPTASTMVSEKLLKVITCTMSGFQQFNWAQYIINVLWKEMAVYVNSLRKSKGGRCNMGGCIYLLLLYFGEHFALLKDGQHDSTKPMHFWTDERLKEMVRVERESYMGILYSEARTEVREGKEATTIHLDPELKELHSRLVGAIEESSRRLINVVEKELLKVQLHRHGKRHRTDQLTIEQGSEGEEDSFPHEDERKGDKEGEVAEKGEGEGHRSGEGHIEEEAGQKGQVSDDDDDDPISVSIHSEGHIMNEAEVLEEVQLRRSKRQKRPAASVMSPWVLTKGNERKKMAASAKDEFFTMISRMCSREEGQQVLVNIMDEDISRDQLYTLGGIQKISNRVMSVVCKTLMADMKKEGPVRRHLFDADFMTIMASNPITWNVNSRKKQLMPEHVGYNLGDCDLIIGPTLVGAHWFCLALEPRTMNFYVLDSLVENVFSKKGKKASAKGKEMTFVVKACRDRFYDIIELVKPNLLGKGKKRKGEIIWPQVPLQNNLRDCGVHVLIWLTTWEPNIALDYDDEHVAEFRRNLLWWLVNHELNSSREFALSLLLQSKSARKTK